MRRFMKTVPVTSDLDLTLLKKTLQEEVDPHVLQWDRLGYFPKEIYAALHKMELMHHGLPKELGGNGGRMIDLCSITRAIATHSPGIASGYVANLLALTAITRFAPFEVARKFTTELAQSHGITSFCATERESGTDLMGTRTTARKVSGGYSIQGGKCYITNINYSTHLVVLAQLVDPSLPKSQLSAFCLRKTDPGVRVGEPLEMLGQRESNTGQVSFEDVFVPEENLLGRVGDGALVIGTCLSRTRTLVAAIASGVCDRAELEALNYLQSTYRYGEPLLRRKDVIKVLSLLRVEAEAAWLLACQAGAAWEERGIAIAESSAAKLFAGDLVVRFVSEALELTGATGYLNSSILSKLYRDCKVIEIYEGASLVQQTLFEREIYGDRIRACSQNHASRRAA